MDSFIGEATLDSSGTFTVDLKRALKLSRLATQPRNYPVLLVGLAELCEASYFDLRFGPGRTSVTFNGLPLDPDLMESLPQAFLAPRPGPQLYLARALQAAMMLPAVGTIQVSSGRFTLHVRGTTLRCRPALTEFAGTRVEITEGSRKLPLHHPEVASLEAYCRWARLRIRVNDRALWERQPEAGFWFPPGERGPTRVTLVENGISYGPVSWDLGLPGGEGVVYQSGIPKDLSLLNLRHDGDWEEQLRQQLASVPAEPAKNCPTSAVGRRQADSAPASCRGQFLAQSGGRPGRFAPLADSPKAPEPLVERATLEPLALETFGSRVAVLGRSTLKIWSQEGHLLSETPLAARPGASTLAVHEPWLVAGGSAAVLLDSERIEVLRRYEHLDCAAFRQDGSLLACASGQEISLVRPSSGSLLRRWRVPAATVQLGWHPHGEWLFALSPKGQLSLWTVEGQRLASPVKLSPGPAEFSPRGDLLAFGGELYRCPGDEVHRGGYRQVRFVHQGESFVALQRDRLEVRRCSDGQLLWERPKCSSFELSPDRQRLALGNGEFVDVDGNASQDWSRPAPGAPAGCLNRLEWGAESLVASGPQLAFRLSGQGCLGRSQVLAACDTSLVDRFGVCLWSGERLLDLPDLTEPVLISAGALVTGGFLRRPDCLQILDSWEGAEFALSSELVVIRTASGVRVRRLRDNQSQLLTTALIARMELSADGSHLALQHRSSPRLEVWRTGLSRPLFTEIGAVWPWALSADGSRLAMGNPLRILATDRPQARQRFEKAGVAERVFVSCTRAVQAGPDGTHLFWLDSNRVCQLSYSAWTAVAFRPDGLVLAGLDEESRMHFFTSDGESLGSFHPLADGSWVGSQDLVLERVFSNL